MKITRLYLRNFRTFEQEVDLELPAGLIGIYGANGAGKSALIESIRWTLYGKARTGIADIRTTGVLADCITEVEFEHEGHLYTVRRAITGANSTQKVSVEADKQLIASSVTDVARYVHQVLGMDDHAFRASVYAEQKQIAAFSSTQPNKRKELVLRLLGITPLDRARTAAAKDARENRAQHERLKSLLGDLDSLHERVADTAAAADSADAEAIQLAVAAQQARAEVDTASEEVSALLKVQTRHQEIVNQGKLVATELDSATKEADRCRRDLDDLADADGRLPELEPVAAQLGPAEARLALVRPILEATEELAQIPALVPPPPVDEAAAETARARAAEHAARLAEVGGLIQAATSALDRARERTRRTGQLSGEDVCPLCGQALNDAFAQVQAQHQMELVEAEKQLAQLGSDHAEAAAAESAAAAEATAASARLDAARAAWTEHDQLNARRDAVEGRLRSLTAALDHPAAPGEVDELMKVIAAAKVAADQVLQLRTRLERREQLHADFQAAGQRAIELTAQREALLEQVKALGFSEAGLAAGEQRLNEAQQRLDVADRAHGQAHDAAIRARGTADAAISALKVAEEQHAQIRDLAETSRHLDRLSGLMTKFRDDVVSTVGPRLATYAADLFAELTDNEYDALQVDPETYELQIQDAGRSFGMDRYSGSEVDLANLALRVAISQHTRLQSGGSVGLLVLDEVFGPLDSERKMRMLDALERLKSRFRQVLVVTHDQEIKEQLPNAIEVVKIAPRRATARLMSV